jgi:TRAP-type C4-dicarboxylate transport system permease small subunit
VFLAVVLVTLYEVVARYGFGRPTSWAQEITIILCSVAFAVGGAHVQALDEHIRVTVLSERAAPALMTVLDILGRVLGIIFLAGVVYGGWRDAWEALSQWQTTQSAFNSPMPAIVKPTVIVVCLMMALILVGDIVRRVRGQR